MKHYTGQTSVILILLAAIALIFFAVTLHWGRVSQMKAQTTVAATNAATGTASTIASYAENQIQTTLGGQFKHCKVSSLFGAILSAIVAIVIVALIAFCPAGAVTLHMLIALIVTIAASAASIAITAAYIEPKTTQSWNKMQAALPINDRFLEQGLSGAAQGLVTDQSKITDYFDMNVNGHFGSANLKPDGKPDMVSRFGYFYTERLRALKKFGSGVTIDPFLKGLGALQGQITEACMNPDGSRSADPHCDACCVPLTIDVKMPDGTTKKTPVRPADCSQDPVPAQCAVADPKYPFIYDLSYPDYTNGKSFLAQFGVDSEEKPFNKKDAKGIFSMFWDMMHMRDDTQDPGPQDPSDTYPYYGQDKDLAPSLNSSGALDSRVTDKVLAMDNFKAPDNQCAEAITTPPGFWWKRGADQHCSETWPYDQCACADDACATCTSDTAANWPEDSVDGAVYGLKEFSIWSQKLLEQDGYTLLQHLDEWLQGDNGAAFWFGPACNGTNDLVCQQTAPKCNGTNDLVCHGGFLYGLSYRLGTWSSLLDNWLNTDYSASDAWCVPPAGSGGMPPPEISAINTADTAEGRPWGSLTSTIACLNWNIANIPRFQTCKDKWTGIDYCGTPACASSFNPCSDAEKSAVLKGIDDSIAALQATVDADCPCGCGKPPPPCDCGWVAACEANITYIVNVEIPALQKCRGEVEAKQCPTALPPECIDLPRSLAGGPPPVPDPLCKVPQEWLDFLQESSQLADPPQVTKFQKRSEYLTNVKAKTKTAKAAVDKMKTALDDFLAPSGPASTLAGVGTEFQMYLDKLPSFIVYGWQGPTGWHLVRAEAQAPGNCTKNPSKDPGVCGNDNHNKLPWIKTSVEGFLGRKRCSELTDYNGRALVRVTRWDGGGAVVPALSDCIGQGLGNATNYIVSSGTPADKQAVKQAFMLNTVSSDPSDKLSRCWNTVDTLLSQGTKTTVCAGYGPDALVDPTHNAHHMVVKFDGCPAGAFDENKTLGN